MFWKFAPDPGFESNANAQHHTQLKMANRRQFRCANLEMTRTKVRKGFVAVGVKTH
jgi:hypothetical protein